MPPIQQVEKEKEIEPELLRITKYYDSVRYTILSWPTGQKCKRYIVTCHHKTNHQRTKDTATHRLRVSTRVKAMEQASTSHCGEKAWLQR